MAIRIRTINGITIAICAARSIPKEGDIYLSDGDHEALSAKFALDFLEMEFLDGSYIDIVDPNKKKLMEQEESNNENRDWWDKTFGPNGYLDNLV